MKIIKKVNKKTLMKIIKKVNKKITKFLNY